MPERCGDKPSRAAAPPSRASSTQRWPRQPYGDLVQLNTQRTILDAVGGDVLEELAADYLDQLQTSSAIYETNGDYAMGIFSSGWCRLMDSASRRLCDTDDNEEALASGRWHCHESCWRDAARPSIERREPVDIPCRGGIRLYALPIEVGEEVVGSINFGYGAPPTDEASIRELAERYQLQPDELRAAAESYVPPPPEAIELAKRRLHTTARLIAEMVRSRRAEEEARRESQINQTLHRLAAAFATELDEQRLLQLVTDEATQLTGARFGAFFFITEEGEGAYQLYTLSGAPAEAFAGFRMPRATPLFGPTLRGEEVIRLGDVRRDPRFGRWGPMPPGHLPVVSYLAVPVKARSGEVLGALFFGHDEADRFSEGHERIATGIAALAGITLENARLYTQLRRSEASAREAEQRKDQLLAVVGHELRNPLAPISTALDLMRLRGSDAFSREREVIARQVRHMTRLVDDLLDVARILRGKLRLDLQRVEVREVLNKAVEMAAPELERGLHELALSVPEAGLAVEADPFRLAQVFANLLSNAAKYSPPRSEIAVEVRDAGDSIALVVRDNGIGIAPDILPDIFDKFVQASQPIDRARGGLGLGLAIVRNITELHGGRVEARSEGEGRGTEFVVELPRARCAAARAPAERPAPAISANTERRILIVDDNADAAGMLASALTERGFAVAVAHDGPEALSTAPSFCPELGVLDIGLPVMDGYELARRLRQEPGLHDIPLVAVSGYGLPGDHHRSIEAGFAHHLVKPVSVDALTRILTELLDGRPEPG